MTTTSPVSLLRTFHVPAEVTSRRFAWRENTRALFEVSDELHDALAAGGPEPGSLLAAQVEREITRLDRFGFWYGPGDIPDADQMSIYALNLAHVCNLACSYCNVNQGNYTGEGPTLAEQKLVGRALDRIPELFGSKTPTVVFYGGEPLINWGVLQWAVARCLERDPETVFQIVTNGTLIDDEKADFFARHNFYVIVSIDGPPELQDAYRKTVGGKGSSKAVEAGVRRLRDREVEFTLRATWAVDRDVSYSQVREYLAELAGSPLRVAIGMEFQQNPAEHDDKSQAFLHQLGESFRDVACDPVDQHLPATARSWANILFRADLADPPGCPAGKRAYLVTPGGNIHPCQVAAAAGELKMGSVHNGLDSAASDHARDAMTHERLCPGCWLEPVCQQSICPLGGPVPEDYFACVQYRKEFTGLLGLLDVVGYDALARNQFDFPGQPLDRLRIAERLLAVRNLVARQNRHLKPLFYVPIGVESRTRQTPAGQLAAFQNARIVDAGDGLAG